MAWVRSRQRALSGLRSVWRRRRSQAVQHRPGWSRNVTILNAFQHPAHVEIVVDTATDVFDQQANNRGGKSHVSKLFFLPHIGAVIAARGMVLLPSGAAAAAAQIDGDYHAFTEQFPAILKGIAEETIRRQPELAGAFGEHELVTAGWCERRRKLDLTLWLLRDGAYRAFDCGGSHVSPATEIEVPTSVERHLALAERQAAMLREAGHAAGGYLIIARLARDGVMIRRVQMSRS